MTPSKPHGPAGAGRADRYLSHAWVARLMASLEGSRGRSPLPPLRRSALVLVDLQALFLDTSSPARLHAWQAAAPATRMLLDEARHLGIPVIWTQHVHPPMDGGGTVSHFFGRLIRAEDPLAALAAGWNPRAGEPVFRKARHPAFAGTELHGYLRRTGVETLVLAGVQAHLCVLATAVWAGALDYVPVVVVDATAARTGQEHAAAVQVLSGGLAHVATAREVLTAWRKAAAEGTR